MDPRYAVEHFHLSVCRLLLSGPDRRDFAIKGGCNLRFFFDSPRYSEDLDLDVQRLPTRTLKGRVEKLLESAALLTPLRSAGIEVLQVTSPKQTETTQRWKAALRVSGNALPLHTKIEFSRRDAVDEAQVEPIAPGFASAHRVPQVVLSHYPAEAAVAQKARALVGRAQVQARDVFDLAVLFARIDDAERALAPVRHVLKAAIERTMELSFDDFSSQVVSYLSAEAAAEFGHADAWASLQLQVAGTLEGAAP